MSDPRDQHSLALLAGAQTGQRPLAFADLAGMSPRFAEIAGQMVGQNGHASDVLNQWLAKQTDGNEISTALLKIEPAPGSAATGPAGQPLQDERPRLRTRKLSDVTA